MKNVPLLALPGLLDDERLWRAQTAALLPEHAVTSFALTPHTSMAELASMALARAPAERFALAGLSMGGYLAFEIMRQAPQRVVALALLDTSARADTPEQTEMRRALMAQSGSDFGAAMAALLPRMVHPSRLAEPAIVDVLDAMSRSIGREGFMRQQEAIIGRVDSRPALATIACPTLVLCGREDLLTPLELHEEMAAGIVGSELVVIEACGHMSPIERPQEVNDALRRWLGSIEH